MKIPKTFNSLCYNALDKLYDPMYELDEQPTGYKLFREMVQKDIKPASLEEIERWTNNPTPEELMETPPLKYMQFLHPNVRPFVIKHWEFIRNLPIH